MNDQDSQSKELPADHRQTMKLYALFAASLVVSVIPRPEAAIVSLVLFIVLLAVAYAKRNSKEDDSLLGHHCTYVIRSIWIVSLMSLFTMAAGGLIVALDMDMTGVNACMDELIHSGRITAAQENFQALKELVQPCEDIFYADNHTVLMKGAIVAAGPALVYLALRFFRGFSRASKGYRMAKPKAWF